MEFLPEHPPEANEPHTPGVIFVATAQDDPSGTDHGILLIAMREGVIPTEAAADDTKTIGRVKHISDARRIVAALRQVHGLSTNDIESMPYNVAELSMKLLARSQLLRDVYEAIDDDQEWASMRDKLRAISANAASIH